MKAVVFRHNTKPIGTFAPLLHKAGIDYDLVEMWRDDLPDDFDALAPDLLVVMGGTPGVYQKDDYPFLRQELKILEKRLAADLPTLGICLGGQLIAGALGAKNYKGHAREIGWCEVSMNEAGLKTPVRHFDKSLTRVTQSHGDTFDLPSGAALLASSTVYPNQAFSWGRNVMAFQFHPEADANTCREWYVSYAGSIKSDELRQWRADTERYLPAMERQTEKFLSEWLAGRFEGREMRRA